MGKVTAIDKSRQEVLETLAKVLPACRFFFAVYKNPKDSEIYMTLVGDVSASELLGDLEVAKFTLILQELQDSASDEDSAS